MGNKAASYFGGDVTPEEVRKLQNIILPTIQTVIDTAEAIPADKLKPWLMDLKAAVLEAEDVLDLCEYKNIKNKVSGHPDSLNKLIAKTKEFSRFVLPKTALRNSLEKLQESADNAKQLLDLIRYVPPRDTKRQQSTAAAVTVSVPSSPIFGRDEERNDLIDMLISEHDHESSSTSNIITQHALYGVGGAGKTTLAQYVYNNERVEGHFDTRMWVHVPRNLDVRRVTKEIIESAGQGTDISNLDALQKKLEQLLNSKRFLLILDDVWCEDRGEWDKLLVPLNKSGNVGSRILITTRMERVALTLGVKIENIRSLKELRPEDCWSILKHYAFGDVKKAIQDQDLAATGKKIAYKLKNSPLAARLVGSLLVRNVDVGAWNKFLKEDLLGGTLDNLQWSFQYLPLHLQSCFAFCSLYPKGYSFSKDELVWLWVAEGFVVASEKDGLTAVEKGQQYFDELMSCSFFQPNPTRFSRGYIIHDLLHDLAEEVSKGHYFRIEGDEKGIRMPEIGRLTLLQTLSFYYVETSKGYGIEQLKNLQQLRGSLTIKGLENVKSKTDAIEARLNQKKHLEELILVWESKTNTDGRADEDVLEGLKLPPNLRKLKIRGYRGCPIMGSLPNLPASLKELDVRDCAIIPSLPENLEELPSLERLLIRGCPMMGSLPNLPASLKELDVGDCAILPSLPENLEKLPSLERLSIDGCPMMGSLPNLPASLKALDVCGCFVLLFLPDSGSAILPSLPVNLEELPSLERLQIDGCPMMWSLPKMPASLKELDVCGCDILPSLPENLEELPSLERLQIDGCPKMGSLPKQPASLKALHVRGCAILSSLPENLEELPSLERLQIDGCPKMGSLPKLPASLKALHIRGCAILPSLPKNVEELPSLELLQIDGCPKMGSLPKLPTSLKAMHVRGCAILPSLPENLEELPSLELLEIDGCPKMGPLPKLPTSLVRLDVRGCTILPSLPKNLEELPSLERQQIDGCPMMGSLPKLPASLVRLDVRGCAILPSLPKNLEELPSLERLSIDECLMMGSLPNLPASLKELQVRGCAIFPSLPENLEELPSLERLLIDECPKMGSLPNMPASLVRLDVVGCDILPSLPENLEELPSLEGLWICECPMMESLPNLPASLVQLKVYGCDILPSLPENLEELPSLEGLSIRRCPMMGSLPKLPASLVRLDIVGCDILKKMYGEGGPLCHEINHIASITLI